MYKVYVVILYLNLNFKHVLVTLLHTTLVMYIQNKIPDILITILVKKIVEIIMSQNFTYKIKLK